MVNKYKVGDLVLIRLLNHSRIVQITDIRETNHGVRIEYECLYSTIKGLAIQSVFYKHSPIYERSTVITNTDICKILYI